jgi:hypothetical protein
LGGRGLTFQKRKPEARFFWASGKLFMLIFVLPDSNKKRIELRGTLQGTTKPSREIIT